MKKYVYSESIFNANLKKFPLGKINSTKNALFFLLRAPTHHNFTFNLRFLYELKCEVRLSKTVCGIFHFRFPFVFIKAYIFVQQNVWTLWLKNFHNLTPFKIKIMEKPHAVLLPDLHFKLQQDVLKFKISVWVRVPKKLTCWLIF